MAHTIKLAAIGRPWAFVVRLADVTCGAVASPACAVVVDR